MRLRRTLREWPALRKLYYAARGALSKPADPITLRLVPEAAFRTAIRGLVAGMIERHGKDGIGDYVEFGVFNGATLASVYQVFEETGLTKPRFFGFDSFEGLPPEADREGTGMWMAGQCSCPIDVAETLLKAHRIDWHRVVLTKGWFKDTLTPAFIERHRIEKACLVMVDSDLYSSAVEALAFVEPLIRDETVIIFDDWFAFQAADKNLGEKKAFDEFMARHPVLNATELGSYDENSMIFRVSRGA